MRKNIFDILFPSGDARKKTSELIERGLEALRVARDERALAVGATTLVPSRLELRLPQIRYDELAEVGAVHDIEYFLNDELLKDLAANAMRTFGDRPVYITVAADTSLQPNEIYGAVLSPESGLDEREGIAAAAPPYDRTSVLGEEQPAMPAQPARDINRGYRLLVRQDGKVRELHLSGRRWIVGRRGTSGRALPEGYSKVDVDFPPTVSREQVRIEMIAADRMLIERIGQAPVLVHGSEELHQGEQRLIALGAGFVIDECEMVIR